MPVDGANGPQCGVLGCRLIAAGVRRASRVPGSDDDDALAPTRATLRQHFAAAGRLHALAETVHPCTTTGLRLICALHDRVPSPLEAGECGSKEVSLSVCAVQSISRIAYSLATFARSFDAVLLFGGFQRADPALVFHRCGNHSASACGERNRRVRAERRRAVEPEIDRKS